jgi:transcriptional regulator with XRE-family HTH domain
MTMLRTLVGRNLAKLRQGKLSQRGLAKRSGVSRITIAEIERGACASPRLDTLQKLATALECEVADLIQRAS